MPTKKIYKAKAVAMPINWRKVQHMAFILLLIAAVYFLLVHGAYADSTASADTTSILSDKESKAAPEGVMDGSLFIKISDFLFAGLSPMEQVLCSILLLIVGDVGRGVATLAVMSLGIGAMMGKVSWGQALTVASGIGIMFGATLILPLLLFDPFSIASHVLQGDLNGVLQNDVNFPCIQISTP